MVDKESLLRVGCALVALAFVVVACSGGEEEVAPSDIAVSSSAFSEGSSIPMRHTCDGEDVSPPLSWSGAPSGTRSLALISDDPDAGSFVHWILYGIPADVAGLPESMTTGGVALIGAKSGTNDFGKTGYGGPCPPSGSHRYVFKVYALDAELNLESGVTKNELLEAMSGHILSDGQLTGTYQRQ